MNDKNDILVTVTGASATGKTTLISILSNLLGKDGFDVNIVFDKYITIPEYENKETLSGEFIDEFKKRTTVNFIERPDVKFSESVKEALKTDAERCRDDAYKHLLGEIQRRSKVGYFDLSLDYKINQEVVVMLTNQGFKVKYTYLFGRRFLF